MAPTYTIIYSSTLILNMVLGFIVWVRNPKGKINNTFVVFIIGIIFWAASLYGLYNLDLNPNSLTLLGRFNFFVSSILIYFLFLLTYVFPSISIKFNKKIHYIFIFETIFLSLITLLSPLIDHSEHIINGSLKTQYGSLYFWFVIHFLFFLISSLILLFKKLKVTYGYEKNQLRLLFLGFMATGICASITNLFLPLIFNYYDSQALGPVSTIFMISAIAYSVIKHKLLDITLVVFRTLIYFLTLAIIFGFYALVIFASSQFISDVALNASNLIIYTLLALFISITISPLKTIFENTTKKIFFKNRYDREQLLSSMSKIMATTIDLDLLGPGLLNKLSSEFSVPNIGLYVLDNKNDLKVVYKSDECSYTLPPVSKLHNLGVDGNMLIFDEMSQGNLKHIMRNYQISIFIPLNTKTHLIAYLILGPKSSGDIYFTQDIKLLHILSSELTLALQNAISYREIQEFSRTLEKKVEERTKELEEAQQRELAKAKEVIRLKDEFVFIATHDLRTPVTAFKGYVELIKNQSQDFSPDLKENIDAIEEAGNRLNQLVDDLLEVSRSESGTMKINLVPIDAVKIIEESVRQVEIPAQEKAVQISQYLDQKNRSIIGDADKFAEIMENLLSNAVKFSHQNGKIHVQSQVINNMLQVTVSDTGYGIPKIEQGKIFQKFFKYRGDDTMSIPGTGLGLFVVRMLIQKMNGTITFSSIEGQGTSFIFTLPLAKT